MIRRTNLALSLMKKQQASPPSSWRAIYALIPAQLLPLSPDLQEHCEKSDLINSLRNMFVKISSHDVIHFGLDKIEDFCVSKSVFENMINSFKLFKPEKLHDQKCFQKGNGISSEFILSFDQFLKHSKGIDHFEKSLELDLKQTDFCDLDFCDFVLQPDL